MILVLLDYNEPPPPAAYAFAEPREFKIFFFGCGVDVAIRSGLEYTEGLGGSQEVLPILNSSNLADFHSDFFRSRLCNNG
jgi:hypothetical protein